MANGCVVHQYVGPFSFFFYIPLESSPVCIDLKLMFIFLKEFGPCLNVLICNLRYANSLQLSVINLEDHSIKTAVKCQQLEIPCE